MSGKKVCVRGGNWDAGSRVWPNLARCRAGARGAVERLKILEIAVENSRLDI